MRVCLEQQRDLEPMIEQKVFSSRVKTFIDFFRLSFLFWKKECCGKKGDRQTNIFWAKRRARENKEFLCTWLRVCCDIGEDKTI